ncbi:MAG: HAMP domain-containing protein [Candidatus Shapirobacteria bacterium]
MNSIRNKIQNALIISIVVISGCAIVILYINQIIISQTQKVINTMTKEHSLISQTNSLVQAYNNAIKSANDSQLTTTYQTTRTELLNTIQVLKTEVVSSESRATLIGVENTISKVIQECDTGIKEVQNNDFSNISNHYSQANINNDFVYTNTQTLIQKELEYLSLTQEKSKQVYTVSTLISMAFFVFIILIMVIYASSFSKQLVAPVQNLIQVTQEITAGNMNKSIGEDLINQKNEIGVLAKSFAIMVDTINAKISELNTSNQELTASKDAIQASRDALEISNSQLEKLNSFMTNRELKMIELKEKITKLESNT